MLARENFEGPHGRHNRRTLPQDSRARRARLAGRARRGGNPICPRRAFLASLALRAPRPVVLADFFSILLGPHKHDRGKQNGQRKNERKASDPGRPHNQGMIELGSALRGEL